MQRFAFALALAMSTAAGSTAGEADKTSPVPEDRFLWLEDVTGDKALAWVRERNAESAKELGRRPRSSGAREADPRRSSTPKRTHPRGRQARALLLQLLAATRRTRAGSGGGRRSRSTARPSPPGRRCSTSTRSARRRRRTGSGTARSACKPDYERCLVSLSRGGADADVVREFDLETKALRRRTASPCPRPRARSPGATATASSSGTDFGPGSLTTSGYPRIVKEWKRGTPAGGGRDRLRGQARRHDVVGLPRPDDPRASSATSSRAASPSTRASCSCAGTASSSRSRSPTTPTPTSHRDLLCVSCATDWTVGGKTYSGGRAARDATSRPSSKGERDFDVLFEPTRAHARWPALSPTQQPRSCSTSWTTSATASTC